MDNMEKKYNWVKFTGKFTRRSMKEKLSLSSQKEEFKKVVERMKRKEEEITSIPQSMKVMQDIGYNEAVEEILKAIEELDNN